MAEPLIILGASSRAAAGSAARAGFQPWCVDLFADRDTQALGPARQCPAEQYPTGLLAAIEEAPIDAKVLVTGALENHPRVLDGIELERPLFGTSAAAMQKARDPRILLALPSAAGIKPVPVKTFAGPVARLKNLTLGALTRQQFLVKPIHSAGGLGIDWWQPAMPIGREHYLQQYVRGQAMSAVYRADGWSALLLGATEQLIGERDFGAAGFRYCGSIGPMSLSDKSRKALAQLGVVLTQRFDLRGVFGVDLVMDWRGRLRPVEINPRYPASTEIVERMTGLAALKSMRDQPRKAKLASRKTHGKAILFAKARLTASDLYDHLPQDAIADVPPLGRVIDTGKPICTVFASAPTRERCERLLRERASVVYRALDTA
jgi:predicted ATP-grasp superfamily ATP-dependent carboligase